MTFVCTPEHKAEGRFAVTAVLLLWVALPSPSISDSELYSRLQSGQSVIRAYKYVLK